MKVDILTIFTNAKVTSFIEKNIIAKKSNDKEDWRFEMRHEKKCSHTEMIIYGQMSHKGILCSKIALED